MLAVCSALADWAIPFLICVIPLVGHLRGVQVYETFVEGASEGFALAVKLMPFLIAMMVSVTVFRESGAMSYLVSLLTPALSILAVPPELLPLALMRPLSGTASLGISSDLMQQYGPDSLYGYIASTAMGCTDTTFYILSVYFGAVGVTQLRYAPFVGICSDLIGFLLSVWLCQLFF